MNDLIVEIISWLPVKSLLRFKSVSKTWHSIISDPKFAKLQLTRTKQNYSHINCHSHRLLLTTCPPQSVDYDAFEVRNLSYPAMVARDHQDSYVAILGSCNGLLVCLLDVEDLMFIWNPTTGDCSRIPNPNAAFYSILLHGIGYNRSTDDYGVVFASRFTANGTKETIIELYSLKTKTWRRIEDTDLIPKLFDLGSGISWNGDLYWLSIKESVYTVICFDMVEEKFKEILPLPDHIDPNVFTVNLGMYENWLCVFSECNGSSFEGFILKMNGNEVSCNRVFRYPHDRFTGYGNKALCLTENGQVVMDSDGWEIYLYDPKLGKCYGNFWLHHDTESESALYQESLVSPNLCIQS